MEPKRKYAQTLKEECLQCRESRVQLEILYICVASFHEEICSCIWWRSSASFNIHTCENATVTMRQNPTCPTLAQQDLSYDHLLQFDKTHTANC